MPSGTAGSFHGLPAAIAALISGERRAVMTTIQPDGSPHSVPVVIAHVGDELVSPIDHKPKTGEILRRVKNIERDDRVTILIDHWDEDWTQLAWLMVRGRAIVETEPPQEMTRPINERYEQYDDDQLHDAVIRIAPTLLSWWSWVQP